MPYPGILTGKLSDFAGLFIFPYFFSVFFEKQSKYIYIATGLFFMYWKLEMAQPFIDWLSSVTHLGVYRTVDVTDLIALLILPFSYWYFKKEKECACTGKGNLAINISCYFASAVFLLLPPLYRLKILSVHLKSGQTFIVPLSEQKQLKQEYKGHLSIKDIL